jgi:hypothetical protein
MGGLSYAWLFCMVCVPETKHIHQEEIDILFGSVNHTAVIYVTDEKLAGLDEQINEFG